MADNQRKDRDLVNKGKQNLKGKVPSNAPQISGKRFDHHTAGLYVLLAAITIFMNLSCCTFNYLSRCICEMDVHKNKHIWSNIYYVPFIASIASLLTNI